METNKLGFVSLRVCGKLFKKFCVRIFNCKAKKLDLKTFKFVENVIEL